MKNTLRVITCFMLAGVLIISCQKSATPTNALLVKEISVALAAANENPQPAGRNETGTATIKIFNDNSITVEATVSGLASNDNLTLSRISIGDPVTNGATLLDLPSASGGSIVRAGATGVRSSLIDSIKNGVQNIYINIYSTQANAGLLRGQLANPVVFAANVILLGAYQVPAVNTSATGVALLRITKDNKLYSRVTVVGLESNDALESAHYHMGAAGINGQHITALCNSISEFNTSQVLTPDKATLDMIQNESGYVYVMTVNRPNPDGLVRGQVRP